MSVPMYSQIFWIRMLFPVTFLFSMSKFSYETSSIQNRSNVNSSHLFQDYEIPNLSSDIPMWLIVFTKAMSSTPSTSSESGDGMFRWNKTSMTAMEFQYSYCSRQCRDDLPVSLHGSDWCSDVKCFPCECSNPLCELYGTCCPDYYTPSVDSNNAQNNTPITRDQHWNESNFAERSINLTKDTSTHVVCSGYGKDGNLSKRSCPSNYPDGDVKFKCQNDIPRTEQDLDTFLHVTDNFTGCTYYNEYCATCNNVSHLISWTLFVECENYTTVYASRTPEELLRLSLASDSGCQTHQRSPDGFMSHPCRRHWFGNVVDTCNVTGEWDVYDEDVVEACAHISGLVNRVYITTSFHDIVYKNVFCAICNKKGYPRATEYCDDVQNQMLIINLDSEIRLPFSILLNFGSQGRITSHRRDVIKCTADSDWISPDNKCVPLQCSPGKILTNGSCTTVFCQMRALVYQIHAYYVPSDPIEIGYDEENMILKTKQTSNLQQTYLNLFQNQIQSVVFHAGHEYQLSLTMVFSDQNLSTRQNETVNTSPVFQISWFAVDGFIHAHDSLSRDNVETFITWELVLNNITVDIDINTTLILTPVLDPHRKQKQTNSNSTETGKLSRITSSLSFNSFNSVSEKDIEQALIIEPHLNCAFVQFNKAEYVYESDNTTKPQSSSITLYFREARMIISDRTELNMVSIDEDGTMRICHELLNTKSLISGMVISNSLLTMSQYVLTLICLTSSVLCLALTLMTYFLFPVLRSVAGKNNMFLCGSLLMAQLSLLATSHVPETSHLCTVLAICTHFLWLSMFCWCFTCCFHMFCIFSAKTRNIQATVRSEMVYIVKRAVMCSVFPGLTIAGVITTNYSISEGQFIGYGNVTCFLDSPLILIITLIVPLCLILLFNFIFFSITVINIYNVGKLQTREFRKDDHNNLYVYIKLSSMTGIFWVFSVISEATDNDPLRFIAIGLNGLQGVFIFLSYICNRRVLRLYLRILGLDKYLTTTSTSDRSTIAKVVADIDKQSHKSEDTSKTE